MAFASQVVLNDPNNAGGSSDAILVYDLQQSLDQWSRYVSGLGTLTVQLNIVQTAIGREDGGPTTTYYAGSSGALSVYGASSLYELTHGQHVTGSTSDITIDVSPSYFTYLDLSQDMGYYSTPAANKYDPAVVFMHEILHGFGAVSYRDQAGALPAGNYESTFDTLTQVNPDGSAYYVGANGEAAEGGPVRLTTSSTAGENYSHFGNTLSDYYQTPATVQDPLTLDLLNGIVLFFDYRYAVSQLDLGMLKDLGYTVRNPAVLASDFSGNGVSDVLWYNPTNHIVGDWLMNNGTPTWSQIGQGSSTVNIEGFGDFTGKGTSDILWENPTNGLVGDWLMSNNQPTWQQIGQGSTTMNIAGVGDFNGDGTADILWQNPTNNYVGIWQMQNNVPTWEAIGYGSTTVNIAGVGDFTGNGKDDILWENPTNNLVGMWAINGTTPVWSQIGQGSTTMNIVGVGDFTGNGTDDILWKNPTNGTVGFWGMNNGQATSWNVVATASAGYQVAGISDYYGNGTDDILWRNASTGDVGVWAMNNGQATWHDLGISSTSFSTVKA